MPLTRTIGVVVLLCELVGHGLWAQQPSAQSVSNPDLLRLGLQDLMNIEVTSVSKRPERLLDAAASIYVITAEDIRRSGVTSLPEALRLAPNLQVAQVSAIGHVISARGFNNSAANKLLVLIDGRSVYTPLFSGVFWDAQDMMLEDIERIEVISGPGGTLWGTNAVNGIINVITRSAAATEGGLVAAGAGNREKSVAVRYGGMLGGDGNYRIHGRYFDRSHSSTANGRPKDDAWYQGRIGFRADWDRPDGQLTVLGNGYRGGEGQPLPGTISISGVKLILGRIPISGWNVVSRWKRVFEGDSNLTLQAYFDRTERTVPPTFSEALNIVDVQLQHSLRAAHRNTLSWGAQYRHSKDRVVNSVYFAFLPAKLNQKWASVFAQDEIKPVDALRLTIGARVERNDYTGIEFLPNTRLAWKVAPGHLVWTAASRAVRAPSRFDHDPFVPGSPPFLLTGGPDVRSEVARVYEIGYRGQPARPVTYSVTAFHSVYDYLRTQEVAPSRKSIFFANGMRGSTSGVETWGTYQPFRAWRLSAGFSGLREKLRLKPGSNNLTAPSAQEGRDPARSWRLRSSFDLPWHSEFDVIVRRISALSNPYVPSYSAVDLRYGMTLGPDVELSIAGQNLLANGHGEFTDITTRTEFGRGVFVKIVGRFGRESGK